MTAELDRAVAHILGLKSVKDCEKWRGKMIEEDDDIQDYKRPWVDLTDEDIHNTVGYNETREMYQFALALIAKLKEKNNG